MKNSILYFSISLLIVQSFKSFAQDAKIYNLNTKKELSIIGAGALFMAGSYYFDSQNKLLNEIEILNLNASNINSFDRGAVFNDNLDAAKYSNYFRDGTTLIPLGFALFGKGRKEFKSISLMYLETLIINTSITALTKNTVSRIRPFVYNDLVPLDEKIKKDSKRSFFSGHVSHVASMSFLSAKLFNDLHPESRWKWASWTGAFLTTTATAVLRYEAGRHFPSDVIVGGIVGASIGILIPQLHRVKLGGGNISISGQLGSPVLNYSLKF